MGTLPEVDVDLHQGSKLLIYMSQKFTLQDKMYIKVRDITKILQVGNMRTSVEKHFSVENASFC